MARKYENGYLPKIQYHNERLQVALGRDVVDFEEVERYVSSLNYFVARQKEVYGKHTIAGVDFSESINLLKSL